MAIEFHCSHCGYKVKAPDDAAGKRGKCPACKNSVYIPTPSEEIEPLDFAPLDQKEQLVRKREDEKARQVVQQLRSDRSEPPPERNKPAMPEPVGDARLPIDVETLVIEYAICMADGKLTEAEELARDIHTDLPRAREYIQRLTIDEIPPARLAHIPRGALLGFLKQLSKG